MMASRGMGAVLPSKMPKGSKKARRDDTDFMQYAEGGLLKEVDSGENPGLAKLPTDVRNKMGYMKDGGPVGLYANIAAKKQRIASGSGEKMRSAGSAGAPKKSDFANAAKTAKFAEGGKSTVNAAGNYTKPELRKRIFNAVKAEATAGTGAGEWSARKAQMVAQRYKKAGGGYRD